MLMSFTDLTSNLDANDTVAEFVREKIHEIVNDPTVAETLVPKNYLIGSRRICIDTDDFATYNRDNVTLIDISDAPIEEITPAGLRTAEGSYEFDSLIYATGFDAMTGRALTRIDIRGRNGRGLKEAWAEGLRTLGLQIVGFPNLLTITGPGSPSVLNNLMINIEQHVDWIADCMDELRARGLATIEPTLEAQDAWVEQVNELATLYPAGNSWYLGANIPSKARAFMPYLGGIGPYHAKCCEVRDNDYEGFVLAGRPPPQKVRG